MKKKPGMLILLLVMVLSIGNIAYAAPQLEDQQTDQVDPRRYDILDTITYGISFEKDHKISCYAYVHSANAEKDVVSGILQKKISNGTYDSVYTWYEETYYGQSCDWIKYCNAAGDGEYCFTFNIDIYDGERWEYLTFTKYATRTPEDH